MNYENATNLGLAVAVCNRHDVVMPTPTAEERLGAAIRARREALGLDIRGAAAAAEPVGGKAMSSSTWAKIEAGKVKAYPRTYARIEDVLGWERGSCAAVRDGGSPTLDAAGHPTPVITELSSPGDRLLIVAAGWGALDELTQRRMVELATSAHQKAHPDSSGDNQAVK